MKPEAASLEGIAALLPVEDRERFLLTAARFRNVPEDDEYLQILEAIGFMTLIWTTVPAQVARIIEGVQPATHTNDSLRIQIEEAIDRKVPSFEDLRQITHSIRQQEAVLQRRQRVPSPTSNSPKAYRLAFVSGVLVGAFAAFLLVYLQQ